MPLEQHIHHVRACVRIRPLNETEIQRGDANSVNPRGNDQRGIQVTRKNGDNVGGNYRFHRVFGPNQTNQEVYDDAIKNVVQDFLCGVNATVIAYGQTNSGKTHTMAGNQDDCGIAQCATRDLFEHISQHPEREFLVRVSMCEVDSNCVRDLLCKSSAQRNASLDVYSDPEGRGEVVKNLTESIVTSPSQILSKLAMGNKYRASGLSDTQATSSRSHTLFTITLENHLISAPDQRGRRIFRKNASKNSDTVLYSKLTLVDLAGSGCAKPGPDKKWHRSGQKESGQRNLAHLRSCLQSLANKRPGKISHLLEKQFHQTNLTRLLKPTFAGNARVVMVCTVSPSSRNVEHSIATMAFAHTCSQVQTKSKRNHFPLAKSTLGQHKKAIRDFEKRLRLSLGTPRDSELPRNIHGALREDWMHNVHDKMQRYEGYILTADKVASRMKSKSFHEVILFHSPSRGSPEPRDDETSSSYSDSRCATPTEGGSFGTPTSSPTAMVRSPSFRADDQANFYDEGGIKWFNVPHQPRSHSSSPGRRRPRRSSGGARSMSPVMRLKIETGSEHARRPDHREHRGRRPRSSSGHEVVVSPGGGHRARQAQVDARERALNVLREGLNGGHEDNREAACEDDAKIALKGVQKLFDQMRAAEVELARLKRNKYRKGNKNVVGPRIELLEDAAAKAKHQVQALQAKLGLLAAQVGDWEGNAMYNDGARKNLSKLSGDELQTLEHKQLAQLYQTQVAKAERRVEAKFREELRVRDAKIKEFKYALENRGYQIKREDDRKVTEEIRKLRERVHNLEAEVTRKDKQLETEKAAMIDLEIKYHRTRGKLKDTEKALEAAKRNIGSAIEPQDPLAPVSNRKKTPLRGRKISDYSPAFVLTEKLVKNGRNRPSNVMQSSTTVEPASAVQDFNAIDNNRRKKPIADENEHWGASAFENMEWE